MPPARFHRLIRQWARLQQQHLHRRKHRTSHSQYHLHHQGLLLISTSLTRPHRLQMLRFRPPSSRLKSGLAHSKSRLGSHQKRHRHDELLRHLNARKLRGKDRWRRTSGRKHRSRRRRRGPDIRLLQMTLQTAKTTQWTSTQVRLSRRQGQQTPLLRHYQMCRSTDQLPCRMVLRARRLPRPQPCRQPLASTV